MSEVKHTTGPWIWQDGEECLVGPESIVMKGGEGGMFFARYPDGQHHANARLIAAAPEMLEALDHIGGLSRYLRQGGPDPMDLQELSDALEEAIDMANELVRKATAAS